MAEGGLLRRHSLPCPPHTPASLDTSAMLGTDGHNVLGHAVLVEGVEAPAGLTFLGACQEVSAGHGAGQAPSVCSTDEPSIRLCFIRAKKHGAFEVEVTFALCRGLGRALGHRALMCFLCSGDAQASGGTLVLHWGHSTFIECKLPGQVSHLQPNLWSMAPCSMIFPQLTHSCLLYPHLTPCLCLPASAEPSSLEHQFGLRGCF